MDLEILRKKLKETSKDEKSAEDLYSEFKDMLDDISEMDAIKLKDYIRSKGFSIIVNLYELSKNSQMMEILRDDPRMKNQLVELEKILNAQTLPDLGDVELPGKTQQDIERIVSSGDFSDPSNVQVVLYDLQKKFAQYVFFPKLIKILNYMVLSSDEKRGGWRGITLLLFLALVPAGIFYSLIEWMKKLGKSTNDESGGVIASRLFIVFGMFVIMTYYLHALIESISLLSSNRPFIFENPLSGVIHGFYVRGRREPDADALVGGTILGGCSINVIQMGLMILVLMLLVILIYQIWASVYFYQDCQIKKTYVF